MEERSYRSFQYDTLGQAQEIWHGADEMPVWAQVLPEGTIQDEYYGHPQPRPRQRRLVLPIALFLITCASTFLVGMAPTGAMIAVSNPEMFRNLVAQRWQEGLTYMSAVMGILLAHEMGHFLQALRYHVHASLPFFIPMPFSPIGTMGAVIGMQGSQANRKELFDIGLTGPLAGLALALPLTIIGIMQSQVVPKIVGPTYFGDPLLIKLLMRWLRPEMGPHETLAMSPLLMAGWVGLLITGLNMFPVSQLDGGHVSYALFGRGSWTLARLVLFAAMAFIVINGAFQWLIMLLLVMFIGPEHPPTRNDHVPIGWWRYVLGMASLLLPLLCMAPVPISTMPQ